MSMGPENRFIKSIHRLLPTELHREKMNNPYRGGTADVWYSGRKADIWIEYKWRATPKRGKVVPALEPLQLRWLKGRHAEGRSVWVVVGHPGGAVLFRADAFEKGLTAAQFVKQTISKQDLASWIKAMTT